MQRDFEPNDIPSLQAAIEADEFHKGEWKVEHFQIPNTRRAVIEDSKGPIAFVLYTNSGGLLRISCIWADATEIKRNAMAIVEGIHDAVVFARDNGFRGIVIQTSYSNLANFLRKVMKMEQNGDEYFLFVNGKV